MSPADDGPEPCPDCGGKCLGPEEALTHTDCQSYDYRIERMYEAYPEEGPWPNEFPGRDPEEVEAGQLAAFEAGVERWWLVVPPAGGARPAADGALLPGGKGRPNPRRWTGPTAP